jgi:hypothetical protein
VTITITIGAYDERHCNPGARANRAMSLKAELKQIFYDLSLASEPKRDEFAHFCNHQGIRISFSRARTTWHSIAPSAIKPWWMILEPLISVSDNEHKVSEATDKTETQNTHNNNKVVEVT